MADVIYNNRDSWVSFHSITRDLDIMIKIYNDKSSTGSKVDRYIDTNRALGEIIANAINSKMSLRAVGSRWSMSAIAHEEEWMLDTQSLNIKIPIEKNDLDSKSNEDNQKLFLFQCGNSIKEINNYLKRKKLSLSTSGASNGQTIAGATSTGTHGAALNFGCIHDSIVGVHVIINENKSYLIEQKTQPVLSKEFADIINTELIRDDEMFHAVQVGMGCMGVITGIVIRSEDLYLLDNYVFDLNRKEVGDILKDGSFNHANVKSQTGYKRMPDHFKLFINPYDDSGDIRAEVMYKLTDAVKTMMPKGAKLENSYNKDILSLIEKLSDRASWTAPRLLSLLEDQILPKKRKRELATLGQHFYDTTTGGRTFSCATGVDISQSLSTLNVLISMFKNFGPIPALISIRIVKGTKALLGFTKFPTTCIVEIDGVQSRKSRDLIKLIPKMMGQAGINFSFHWGKMNPLNATLVKKIYGNNYKKWIKQRSRLMTEEESAVFTSDYAFDLGLGEYVDNTPDIKVIS